MSDISFIIPTFNEEDSLPRVVDSIRQHMPPDLTYEIIVMDHGSSDNTAEIARQKGVRVYIERSGTIASQRNLGAKHTTGEIFVFLDADVFLTATWRSHIRGAIDTLRRDPNILTGSWYGIPEDPSWLERSWFKPLLRGKSTHINSGHLIITKHLFDRLGGFSEHLETGEDYDFSMRAKAMDVVIVDNPDLLVIHEGYPETIRDFVHRERWHGKGDYTSLSAILQSKVAVASLAFLILHALLIVNLVFWLSWQVAASAIAFIVLLCLMASYTKYREENILRILINGFLYYWYFLARTLSFFDVLVKPNVRKRVRPQKTQRPS